MNFSDKLARSFVTPLGPKARPHSIGPFSVSCRVYKRRVVSCWCRWKLTNLDITLTLCRKRANWWFPAASQCVEITSHVP